MDSSVENIDFNEIEYSASNVLIQIDNDIKALFYTIRGKQVMINSDLILDFLVKSMISWYLILQNKCRLGRTIL